MTYSYSQLALFWQCPRLWYYRYIKKKERVWVGPARPVGGAIHAGIAAKYEGRDPLEAARERYNESPPEPGTEDYVKFEAGWEQVTKSLKGYDHPQKGERVVLSEQRFEYDMGLGRTLVGIIDQVIEQDGLQWILDTKCIARPMTSVVKSQKLSPQHAAYKLLYPEAKGSMLDIIEKPRMGRIKKDGTCSVGEASYHREPFLVDEKQTEGFKLWFNKTAELIELCKGEGCYPANPHQCFVFSLCPFYDACYVSEDVLNSPRFRDRK